MCRDRFRIKTGKSKIGLFFALVLRSAAALAGSVLEFPKMFVQWHRRQASGETGGFLRLGAKPLQAPVRAVFEWPGVGPD